jgi:copper chaperone CopZ
MACRACASKVQKTAMSLDGVKVAKVSQAKGTAEITYDASKTTPAAIAKYITDNSSFKAEHEGQNTTPKR